MKITAGAHTVSASFVKTFDGPVQDEVEPYEQSLIDVNVASLPGLTTLPHLHDLSIVGPFHITGISETPSREKIFSCEPASAAQEAPCARRIIHHLVEQAYRHPASVADVNEALRFYTQQRSAGAGFDEAIRASLQAILSNPQFLFRFERVPAAARPGQTIRVNDLELASRLSYFLWSAPPDQELLNFAAQGVLHQPAVLARQTRRMLAARGARSLATNFAAQWLSLQNLNEVLPDVYLFPNFDHNLAESMRQETELFFDSIRSGDRDVLDLLNANYTFVDERLARHYGIPDVLGNRFRRVEITDENRRGLLGHASILTLTSTANRTSPVARGKWVMQTLLGSPPPPPPPDVPALIEAADDTQSQSVRQRLEEHRKNPACASCHAKIDGIGFALERFDAIGATRTKDNGVPVDVTGKLFDGTPLNGPASLRAALLNHKTAFLRTFTENLMAYALGRVLDDRDMPEVRSIVNRAERRGDHFSAYILGIVQSPEFLEKTIPSSPPLPTTHGSRRLRSIVAQTNPDLQTISKLDTQRNSR